MKTTVGSVVEPGPGLHWQPMGSCASFPGWVVSAHFDMQ